MPPLFIYQVYKHTLFSYLIYGNNVILKFYLCTFSINTSQHEVVAIQIRPTIKSNSTTSSQDERR